MTNKFLSVLLSSIFLSCSNLDNVPQIATSKFEQQEKSMTLDMDFLDAYKLKIGQTFLFGNGKNFLIDMGIPYKVTDVKTEYVVNSKVDFDRVIADAEDISNVTLHYPGIDMEFSSYNEIIPQSIDIRKTGKQLAYGERVFDTSYTIEQFRNEFPKSVKPSSSKKSSFEMITNEKGTNLERHFLVRKSKDEPNATPLIEFTFDNKKLIFIYFSNF